MLHFLIWTSLNLNWCQWIFNFQKKSFTSSTFDKKLLFCLIECLFILWPPSPHISTSLIHFHFIVITSSFSMISTSSCVRLVCVSKYAKYVEWRKNREMSQYTMIKRIHNKKKNRNFFDERNMKGSGDEWAWTLQWNLRGDRNMKRKFL